jgi:Rieske Fe-S protein
MDGRELKQGPISRAEDTDQEEPAGISRRSFLAGIAVCGATLAGGGVCAVRFMLPTVSFDPPARFKVGYPEEFAEDSVTYDERHSIFVVRESSRFYAMDARCTHLQCLVRWEEDEGRFFCPCHGSKFDRQGENLAGPAPRPLDRLEIAVADDGRIVVDKDRVFSPDHWQASLLEV